MLLAMMSFALGLAGLSTRLTSIICPSMMRPFAAFVSRTTRGDLMPIEKPRSTPVSTLRTETGSTTSAEM